LPRAVRGRAISCFTVCWVMVEPPSTMRSARRLCHMARAIASGSTPTCAKNRLSSAASVAATRFGGRSSAVSGRLRVPSADSAS
jgi:hypothetical protein